jgi:hypothetical protein
MIRTDAQSLQQLDIVSFEGLEVFAAIFYADLVVSFFSRKSCVVDALQSFRN